ncbi:MAG: hypothetical protein COW01_13840 [Bdellovibrionales bacterium CG12_big_fil_rev_8_21_14_0_65_38_15]|nr:MAG: hypothetical protein COW79_16660 [Bdellovibrionales bacterium CG22_combo_CG10-13_8_21_14_all_38_13]PIQ53354.1 MAG: hypothetical protein COW01_13840 [Bdellovibrionales bacterium CG12_big_fil_rev_8_21_14_0_65_38_15]PIR30282.1 MAG: hypothetical protein COV38_05915 [Bdellovibrionales bacterium CG11_big_fil_rev_8_21_14_0_20_38_13]
MNFDFTKVAEDLINYGWHSSLDFFPNPLLEDLRGTLLHLNENELFRPAKVGKGIKQKRVAEIRGDWIKWLSEAGDYPSTKIYLEVMNEFRLVLNRELLMAASEFEAHFAIYPKNTFYKKHLDRHKNNPHRLITTTLYLNKNYEDKQGGALIVEDLHKNHVVTLNPHWGRFVCFISSDFPHEVQTTTVERYSLTGWMRSR